MSYDEVVVNNLINDIRVHGAILIMGAGASFEAGMPLYKQFPPIIWQVVDEFADIKTILGHEDIPAKNIIADDVTKIKQIFNHIEKDVHANLRFKELFKSVNNKHKNKLSIVHDNICRLIHSGYIKLVISLNWDDLLETSWENLYGTDINSSKITLVKPHGDVRNINNKWIYPNSEGYLSSENINTINNVLGNTPATFIILGYSEQDSIITNTFISPSEDRYKFYRIYPSASSENSISAKASEITNLILNNLQVSSNYLWDKVDFSNQVGLESAIFGYRLLPSNVVACPRLPQIEEARLRLDYTHSVIIEGSPGSGKSISAYQLAWDYLQQGWEVLKLNISKLASYDDQIALINDGYKTIFIIDDAQQLEREQIINLMTKANYYSKLIFTQTITSDFTTESITISCKQTVETLYEYYKQREKEILPIIRKTNEDIGRSIGNNAMDMPFLRILDIARKENTAWLFNYSLRGGWKSAATQFAVSKEHDRAEIVLTFIALEQILFLDKPVNKSRLDFLLIKLGHNDQWISNQLYYLYEKKLIIDLNEIRTLHLQMAIRIIVCYLNQASDSERVEFYSILQCKFLDTSTPLLGIVWFFNMLFSFDIKYELRGNLFTDEFNKKLLKRCCYQTESEQKAHAGYVIDVVLRREVGMKFKDIDSNDNFLINWIENVDNKTAYSFSEILNSMINESKDLHKNFVSELNPNNIITNLKSIEADYLYAWANFLDRLLYMHKSKWVKTFCNQIPKREISEALQKSTYKNIYGLSEMLCTLKFIDEEYCFEEYHKCIWIIEEAMNRDFIMTLNDLSSHFLMYLLGEGFLDVGHPNQKQEEAGRTFVSCISSKMLQDIILEGSPRDWDMLYRYFGEIFRYDSQKFIDSFKEIDLAILDSKTDNMWDEQPDELIKLLYMLYPCCKVKVEEWVYSKRNIIKNIDTSLTHFSPRTAEYIYNNDGLVTLAKSHRLSENYNALISLRKYNKKLCLKIIETNLPDIKQNLYNLPEFYWEDYHLFLNELIKVYKYIIDAIICDDDIKLIEEKWCNSLKDKYYSNQRKGLKGLKKLMIIITKNTENHLLYESMERIIKKIDDILSSKPIKY